MVRLVPSTPTFSIALNALLVEGTRLHLDLEEPLLLDEWEGRGNRMAILVVATESEDILISEDRVHAQVVP